MDNFSAALVGDWLLASNEVELARRANDTVRELHAAADERYLRAELSEALSIESPATDSEIFYRLGWPRGPAVWPHGTTDADMAAYSRASAVLWDHFVDAAYRRSGDY